MSERTKWLVDIISAELVQKTEEGCDVAEMENRFGDLRNTAGCGELEALWRSINSLEPGPGFPYSEPSELGDIIAESAVEGGIPPLEGEADLGDSLEGAWLGRCAGCLLGKPVEGWTKERIEEYLVGMDAYPLADYFPPSRDPAWKLGKGVLGEIDGMPVDDDIDYTVLGLHLLETHGHGVRSEDIAREWLSRLPFGTVYTAERIAYMNLVNKLPVPESARYLNPYREWIGAQIRADAWGYALPGRPAEASRLAFRDARVSHTRNGIYGEMMAAAMVAAALKSKEPERVVESGLSVIPAKSRLHEAVERVLGWARQIDDWRDCWELIKRDYGHYSPVHTINNALNVVLALLYGEGDYSTTITIAVMAGWDTDCNGATAGSIMGAMLGTAGIPGNWSEPLHDTVYSNVRGYATNRISGLAARTHAAVTRKG